MKRTRSVSIAIEQRKLTLSIERRVPPNAPAQPGARGPGLVSEPGPAVCPTCGSPWVALNGIALTTQPADLPAWELGAIVEALERYGLHLQSMADGELRICTKSLEEVRLDETKESL